jgi:hypothetical protein
MLLGYMIDLYCHMSRFRIGGAQRSRGETPFVLFAENDCAVKIISIQKYNAGLPHTPSDTVMPPPPMGRPRGRLVTKNKK